MRCARAVHALCARCAKSWPFSTTGSSVSSEDWKDVIEWLLQWTGLLGAEFRSLGPMASIRCLNFRDLNWLCMIPQVGGFQGCYPDNHRNNWRCARAVPALCARCAKTPPRSGCGRNEQKMEENW